MALFKKLIKKLKTVFYATPPRKRRKRKTRKRPPSLKAKPKRKIRSTIPKKGKKKSAAAKRSKNVGGKRKGLVKKKPRGAKPKRKVVAKKKSGVLKKKRPKPTAASRQRKPAKKTLSVKKGKKPFKKAVTKKVSRTQKAPKKKTATPVKKSSARFVKNEVCVAQITHFFSKISVVVLDMQGVLSVGDMVHIKGRHTDFTQKIDSIQIESVNVQKARKGQLVGVKMKQKCRVGDKVYKI